MTDTNGVSSVGSVLASTTRRLQVQAPHDVIMIRPHHFTPNPETAEDNAFQTTATSTAAAVAARARDEFDTMVNTLRSAPYNVTVHVFDDEQRGTPDSVFPNNWLTTHSGGRVAMHAMYAESRRKERRTDVVELLKREYRVTEVVDYSGLEYEGQFLEGTGAMVIDHAARVAYVALSQRADRDVVTRFTSQFGYDAVVFETRDPEGGGPIYHTNVLMSVCTEFAVLCSEVITDQSMRKLVVERLRADGKEVVDISWDQVKQFCGNGIELSGDSGRIFACSSKAEAAFTSEQRAVIERSAKIVGLNVPTIEMAGGSVRCMIAGIHLTKR